MPSKRGKTVSPDSYTLRIVNLKQEVKDLREALSALQEISKVKDDILDKDADVIQRLLDQNTDLLKRLQAALKPPTQETSNGES